MTKSEIAEVAREVTVCELCRLCGSRTNAVPGEGPSRPKLMLIGEAPGRKEDATGRPFVGQAGRILDGALAKAGLKREEVFITSVVKCRPPDNREPKPDEVEACRRYLERQVDALRPRVVVLLGRVAESALTGSKGGLRRGDLGFYRGASLYATYHPAVALHGRPQLLDSLVADLRAAAKAASARPSGP